MIKIRAHPRVFCVTWMTLKVMCKSQADCRRMINHFHRMNYSRMNDEKRITRYGITDQIIFYFQNRSEIKMYSKVFGADRMEGLLADRKIPVVINKKLAALCFL